MTQPFNTFVTGLPAAGTLAGSELVPVVKAGVSSYATTAQITNGALYNITADTHPGIPTGIGLGPNDEFEGAALDTGGTRYAGATPWTQLNVGTTSYQQAGGSLIATDSVAGGNVSIIMQPISAIPSIHIAKTAVAASSVGSGTGGGLFLYNSGNSHCYLILQDSASGPFVMYAFTSPTSFSGTVLSGGQYPMGNSANVIDWNYLAVSVTSTNVLFLVSQTGYPNTFQTLVSQAISGFLGAVTHVGLCSTINVAGAAAVFDWFRRTV